MPLVLTKEQYLALDLIKGGAEIFSMSLALKLRELKKSNGDLLDIGDAMGDYEGHERLPYFGAILTPLGEEVVEDYFRENPDHRALCPSCTKPGFNAEIKNRSGHITEVCSCSCGFSWERVLPVPLDPASGQQETL